MSKGRSLESLKVRRDLLMGRTEKDNGAIIRKLNRKIRRMEMKGVE